MQLARYRGLDGAPAAGILADDRLLPLASSNGHTVTLSELLESDDPAVLAAALADRDAAPLSVDRHPLLAPIDRQEVWAAGVTYRRSRTARMEESADAGNYYDKVYTADRPELFFKASPHRVVGPGGAVRIRGDASWNVPEPELTLVLNSRLKLVGFTIGNDMSSRDIEGENPLYLPQAKVYDACCALGPAVTLAGDMPPTAEIGIRLNIHRSGQIAFAGETNAGQLARSFDDLIGYLGRDQTFPDGVFLLTGTGIVPDDDFTLKPGDEVEIAIDGIGVLRNPVERGNRPSKGG